MAGVQEGYQPAAFSSPPHSSYPTPADAMYEAGPEKISLFGMIRRNFSQAATQFGETDRRVGQ